MNTRVQTGVQRGEAIQMLVDHRPVTCFAGETVATALLAVGHSAMRRDSAGKLRGLFCNMGTCSECFVTLLHDDGTTRRVRACLTLAGDGLLISTGGAGDD